MNKGRQKEIAAAIFDMDGLLLDTEPLWVESMLKVARQFGLHLKRQNITQTRGLRIYEVTKFWKRHFKFPSTVSTERMANFILEDIIKNAVEHGVIMPGAENALESLKDKGVKLGLATSSSMTMVNQLIPAFDLEKYFDTLTSADSVQVGKPHPEVFLQCAQQLGVAPQSCVAFEDSINGMIAAKAARMKVVVVPETASIDDKRFSLADVRLNSLKEFNDEVWTGICSPISINL